ncbi:MAG: DUF3426 domain-containing protein [Candidatus Thiodiazotropha sp.]|nr:MAG: hypothetical protein DBP03_00440 [gamma proteobacterium symbiont of Ctena orbiculata]
MFTQCQHCLTMFRITPEQLKAADGKVRCCQCNNVFNALLNLMESPTPFTNNDTIQDEPHPALQNGTPVGADSAAAGEESAPAEFAVESGLVSDSEVEKSLDALADDQPPIQRLSEESILEVDGQNPEEDSQSQYILEQDDGLETEPDYFAGGTESQMSELLDRDSASLLLEGRGDEEKLAEVISLESVDKAFPDTDQAESADQASAQQREQETLAEETSPELETLAEETSPEQEPLAEQASPEQNPAQAAEEESHPQASMDEVSRFTFEEDYEAPQPNRYRRYWILGALLLLIPLAGQVAWYSRDRLVSHELGRQILQGLCAVAGCEVPIRRDTEQIIISERALTAHPEKEDVLSLKLEMVNAAAFQQPFPRLQLSLYNDLGKLIARRTFLPHEYKSDPDRNQRMMPKLKAVQVELELLDPGDEVTGFKFDFL